MKFKNMINKVIFACVLLFVSFKTFSQPITQTIRGVVIDKESKAPLPYVTVVLLNSAPAKGN
jgi:hypothetical protein